MTDGDAHSGVVFVIDDDGAVRAAVKELLESVGLKVILFRSACRSSSRAPFRHSTSCMVLDVRMPNMSGLTLQEKLSNPEVRIPILSSSPATGISPRLFRAMKAGAVDFLTKPFSNQDLLDAVFTALERDRARRIQQGIGSRRCESVSTR